MGLQHLLSNNPLKEDDVRLDEHERCKDRISKFYQLYRMLPYTGWGLYVGLEEQERNYE